MAEHRRFEIEVAGLQPQVVGLSPIRLLGEREESGVDVAKLCVLMLWAVRRVLEDFRRQTEVHQGLLLLLRSGHQVG